MIRALILYLMLHPYVQQREVQFPLWVTQGFSKHTDLECFQELGCLYPSIQQGSQ